MIKIAITGPECSGKSTLSHQIGATHKLSVVPEYARAYLEQTKGKYTYSDLDLIAQGQAKQWDKLTSSYVSDTEMTVMKIWSEFKYRKTSPTIQTLYHCQQFDYYFLCRPDLPWVSDPLREHPQERDKLFELYLKELKELKRPFSIISGKPKERLKQATDIINSLFLKLF